MEITNPETFLVKAGFVLFILALLSGFFIPVLLNKKMALAAHVTGVMNALMLIVLGLARGTSRQTSVAGAGFNAAPWKRTVVQGLQISLSLAILAGASLVVYGLR
jgi:hypothetical protein